MVEVKGESRRTFSVGDVAARSGVATSALRFYEANGLIVSERTEAGHRRYAADVMRRVGFIKVAQRVGLSLGEIKVGVPELAEGTVPNFPQMQKELAALNKSSDRRITPGLGLVRLPSSTPGGNSILGSSGASLGTLDSCRASPSSGSVKGRSDSAARERLVAAEGVGGAKGVLLRAAVCQKIGLSFLERSRCHIKTFAGRVRGGALAWDRE